MYRDGKSVSDTGHKSPTVCANQTKRGKARGRGMGEGGKAVKDYTGKRYRMQRRWFRIFSQLM